MRHPTITCGHPGPRSADGKLGVFMTARVAGEPLYGRQRELQVLAGLIGGLAEGAGGALAVCGEAGIGIQVGLAQYKARPMPESDRFARIARHLVGEAG